MKQSHYYINPWGYKKTVERDSELNYWITLDRRREKALREIKKKEKEATDGRHDRRRPQSSKND